MAYKNYDYLAKLKEKEIKVIPLEKYINMKTKILHKCTCGNEWNVQPSNVLNDVKCGCTRKTPKSILFYKNSLKEKGIDVIPLEEYKGNKVKILHRCSCGKEWSIQPNNVLNNHKCGCELNPSKSNDWYIKKLEEKEIKVKPLEEYIDSKTPIKHRCYCGNENWVVPPMRVLRGRGCGCKKNYSLRGIDFYRDKETVLYYIKLTLKDKVLYKIGLTLFNESMEKSLKNRFGKELNFIEVQQTKVYKDGSLAFKMEQKIINHNWKVKYNGDKVLKSGNTELFTEDIRNGPKYKT